MMKRFVSLVVGLFCLCTAVQAEVPSLINYQGRLTDKAGTPVNGAIDVVLRVYDAKTEGKKVYEETISQVSVVNGVYSFGYGGTGKTVKRAAEVVVVADGEAKVYNYATEHKPLLGDVQLTDGAYTWGSQSGPSDAAQFIGSINAELGNVTAIYIQNAPANGSIINAVYHYHEEGIVGALSQNKECWQELTINDKTLSPRERLVSVPFAIASLYSNKVLSKKIVHPQFTTSSGQDDGKVIYPPFNAPIRRLNTHTTDLHGTRNAYLPYIPKNRQAKIFFKITNNKGAAGCGVTVRRINLSDLLDRFSGGEKVLDIFPNRKVEKDEVKESLVKLNIKEWDFSKYHYIVQFRAEGGVALNYLYISIE